MRHRNTHRNWNESEWVCGREQAIVKEQAAGEENMYQFVLFSIFRIVSFCVYCLPNVRLILFRIFFSLTSAKANIGWISALRFSVSVSCQWHTKNKCGKHTPKKSFEFYWHDWERERKKTQIKYILYWAKQVLVVATVVHFVLRTPHLYQLAFFCLSPLIVLSRVLFICSTIERPKGSVHTYEEKNSVSALIVLRPLNAYTVCITHTCILHSDFALLYFVGSHSQNRSVYLCNRMVNQVAKYYDW